MQSRSVLGELSHTELTSESNFDSAANGSQGCRFIPNRSTVGDVSKMMLEQEDLAPSNQYQTVLAGHLLGRNGELDKAKVLSFKSKPPPPEASGLDTVRVLYSVSASNAAAKARAPRVIPSQPLKVLDAPDISDNFYAHVVDWSAQDVVSVALGQTVYVWRASDGSTSDLCTVDGEANQVASIKWTEEGGHIAVGTEDATVQLYDAEQRRQLRCMRGHGDRVGVVAWSGPILASGSRTGEIHYHDVRVREHLVKRVVAHDGEVCGLDWSEGGALASGGNDNVVHVWEKESDLPRWSFREHKAAVKAIKWCPWNRGLLATGGGTADRQIKLWNASNGVCIASTNSGSQVSALLWNPHDKELVSGHGYVNNELNVWKYPSFQKLATLTGHKGRVLGLALAPDESTVLSAGGDEALRFWKLFEPRGAKQSTNSEAAMRPKTIR